MTIELRISTGVEAPRQQWTYIFPM